jgi:hypothetical protein
MIEMEIKDYIINSIKYNDENLVGYIELLLSIGVIEEDTSGEGIAKMFVGAGASEMSELQVDTLYKHVILPNYEECGICGEANWNEMSFIVANDYCSSCKNSLDQ